MNKQTTRYSTGNYILYAVINHPGKEYEKDIYNGITLLYSRNQHNTVNHLNFSNSFKKDKKKIKAFQLQLTSEHGVRGATLYKVENLHVI